jgi:molybdate transport system substrate-binding protein
MRRVSLRFVLAILFSSLACTDAPDEITVMISGGLTAAYSEVLPEIEESIGVSVVTLQGSSMGSSPTAIPTRLARGEPADALIMVGYALDSLIQRGLVRPDSRVELAHSGIGMVVQAGAPQPSISDVESLRETLLSATSIAYSASASGRYLSTELFPRLGISEQLQATSREIVGERVGAVVARGEAEIGFQQVSELRPIEGIDFVGPLPPGAQRITTYAAGVTTNAEHPDLATRLIRFMADSAGVAIRSSGMDPVGPANPRLP